MDRQEQLVRKAQDGDRDAFDALISVCRPRLAAVVKGLLGERVKSTIDVDDVCQETCLRAYRSIGDFSWKGEDSFLRWLSVIARNIVLEAAKRGGKEAAPLPEEEIHASEVSPMRRLRREERFDRLEATLKDLSADHRQVILLAKIEKLPLKVVAERMNRSHQAVRQLLRRALQSLKEGFGETESLHLPERNLDRGMGDEK